MRFYVLATCIALAACGPDVTPEEQARRDAEAVAQVKASQTPPALGITPEAIGNADIEKHEMFGLGCSFVPRSAGAGAGAVAITLLDGAFMKVDGEVLRFAPDAGSPETPYGTRVKYDGLEFSMQLEFSEGEGQKIGMETMQHNARFIARDGRDRVIYEADGTAQCGA